MKRKAYEEAGLPLSVSATVKVVSSSEAKRSLLESQLPVVSESLHVKTEKSTGTAFLSYLLKLQRIQSLYLEILCGIPRILVNFIIILRLVRVKSQTFI
jgi:hypothetical protein